MLSYWGGWSSEEDQQRVHNLVGQGVYMMCCVASKVDVGGSRSVKLDRDQDCHIVKDVSCYDVMAHGCGCDVLGERE